MKSIFLQQQIALSILKIHSNNRLKLLLDNLEDLSDFFKDDSSLIKSFEHKYPFLRYENRQRALQDALTYLPYIESGEMEISYYQTSEYPYRLAECVDAPITLFKKGNFTFNAPKMVAIVGTRNISNYGKEICEELIHSFKDNNITVVSGLALGVDVYIHELCLKYGIPTIGVLGHGFNFMYPAQHRKIARAIQENGGLISEYLPDRRPDRIHFPMRNRIIAGLTDATIVIESGEKGGSLITAEIANGYDKEVFAYPGSIFSDVSKGTNVLIRQNKAQLIDCGNAFLESMNWSMQTKNKTTTDLFNSIPELNEKESEIYQYILKNKEVNKDTLMIQFNKYTHELFGLLLQLEMNQHIEFLPSGIYKCAR